MSSRILQSISSCLCGFCQFQTPSLIACCSEFHNGKSKPDLQTSTPRRLTNDDSPSAETMEPRTQGFTHTLPPTTGLLGDGTLGEACDRFRDWTSTVSLPGDSSYQRMCCSLTIVDMPQLLSPRRQARPCSRNPHAPSKYFLIPPWEGTKARHDVGPCISRQALSGNHCHNSEGLTSGELSLDKHQQLWDTFSLTRSSRPSKTSSRPCKTPLSKLSLPYRRRCQVQAQVEEETLGGHGVAKTSQGS